tara:strand:- start:2606 stop:3310 length:705 start_codon:yes stop_codon:yes gene_type:complete
MTIIKSTNIWLNDPSVLFNKEQVIYIWPNQGMTKNEKINAITRLVIILTILGFLVTNSYNFFFTGFITLAIIVFLFYTKQNIETKPSVSAKKEGFTNPELYNVLKDEFTNPSEKNPFMNVLLPEIKDNPKRKMAAPAYNKAVEKKINNKTEEFVVSDFDNDPKLKKKLFSNLGDSFEFEEFAQYNFYATPNTKIPNDQKGFAEFCYGDMISAKEGNETALIKNAPRIGSITGQN